MVEQSPQVTIENLFAGSSEMAALMRSYDWSQTSLGPPEHWSQSLKTAVRIMLTSRQPMFVWWGKDLINLYNDPYRSVLGGKHPEVLGQPASNVWREIWDQVGPRVESAILKNEGTYDEALLLIMERNGYPEETYYTFSYSPIPDDQGENGGIICANTEDTQRIIGERQLALLQELAARTADARSFDTACTLSAKCLETNLHDLPFAMIYLVDLEQQQIFLTGTSGIDRQHIAVPQTVAFDADSVWQLAEVVRTQKVCLISDLERLVGHLPSAAWPRSPQQAVAVPIAPSGQTGKAGILVVGLNPFRLFDDSYRGFIDLVAAQISASIANAQAYEEERKRAEALAEIDRAKTVFFSNVSHEFRTPLTLMLGSLEETLMDDRLSADQREQLQVAQRNSQRLLKLVNTLLDFSRIEAGRIQAVYEPTDLSAFTAELASVFRSAIERAGMQLVVKCPSLPESVYVDREMWEKVVLNLISNAFKFTFTGEIRVALRWVKKLDAGTQAQGEPEKAIEALTAASFQPESALSYVELIVEDTGTGIPAAEMPHLFERFHRVPGARGRTYEGSGIGLSLVQELVKLHGGTISVTSKVDQGSCFVVTIPAGSAHLPSERIGAARTLPSTATGAFPYIEEAFRWLPDADAQLSVLSAPLEASSGLQSSAQNLKLKTQTSQVDRILLADDNADMRDYLMRLLSHHYEVEAVPDGIAALTAIRQRPPSLVLTDVMMPGLDGFGLLRELRADPSTQEIPIIVLSARAGEEARVEGLEAGADDYLTKPFSARELLVRVEATLKLARLRGEVVRREQVLRSETETTYNRLVQLLENMTDAFVALDRDWRIVYQNAAAEKISGKPRSDVLGKTHWEEWTASVGTNVERQYRRAMAEQVPVHFEHHYYASPDSEMWLELHAYPSAEGLNIFFRDVTEHKQAIAALQQSEERYRYLADLIPQLVWIANAEGSLLDVNQRWLNFTGLTLAQVQLQGWEAVVHPDDVSTLSQQWAIAQQQGADYQAEGRMRRADGVYRWHLHQAVPMKNEQGEIIKWFGTATDVEEQKQLEQQRDRVLQHEQVARAKAEQANRIKDEFLAVLSHELRSPLNPILGWTSLLRNGRLDAAKTAYAIETIERNAKLQVQLIEDLLDVSRILRGKLSLTVMQVDLNSVISAALETVQLAAEAKSLRIQTTISPDVGLISGDAGRLQQVLWNLLSNAVKFTPQAGQISLTLTQTKTHAQIQVSDTGKGINPDFLPYIFEHFRQEDGATTRKFGGLGLGLAIVRQIVELHGGLVEAESPGEGQGATFTVKLPLSKNNVWSARGDEQISTLPTPAALPLANVQVLVVDDEVDTRDLIVFVLEQAGAIVTSVSSALAALESLTHSIPDVLVSDVGMPEMDGYTLMQQVREMLPERSLLAIALTAYAGETNQQQAVAAGFQRHISKPIEPGMLLKTISTLIEEAKSNPLRLNGTEISNV
jgi:PAS domain S-box-containing protein